MKTVKGKYMRLTESQLREIVKEAVEAQFSLINEYAIKRKEFKHHVWSLVPQILQNWCLVRYCRIEGVDLNMCLNHWRGELRGHMENIALTDIKGGNSVESRKKVILEVVEDMDLKTDASKISGRIVGKFAEEGIDVESNVFYRVVSECQDSIEDIAEAIATCSVSRYVMSL